MQICIDYEKMPKAQTAACPQKSAKLEYLFLGKKGKSVLSGFTSFLVCECGLGLNKIFNFKIKTRPVGIG